MGKWNTLGTSTAAPFRSAVGACLATACYGVPLGRIF